MPLVYSCPRAPEAGKSLPLTTSYVVVTGPKTLWPGSEAACFKDIPNITLLVAEVSHSDIHWMEPRDQPIADALAGGTSANDLFVTHRIDWTWSSQEWRETRCALADASVHCLAGRFSKEGLERWRRSTRASGSTSKTWVIREVPPPRPQWSRTITMAVFVAALAALSWLVLRRPRGQSPSSDREVESEVT